jgi:hypothetical protein
MSEKMKEQAKFAIVIAGFIVCSLIILFGISAVYEQVVIESKLQFRAADDYEKISSSGFQLDNAFLGASHTWLGVKASMIDNSYNFAYGSNTYIEQYYKLINLKTKPKYIFIETDLESFCSSMRQTLPLEYDSWFYSRFLPPNKISAFSNKSLPKTLIKSNLPFIGNGIDFFYKKEVSSLDYGWAENKHDFQSENYPGKTGKLLRTQFEGKQRLDPLMQEYFKKILEYARDNNITAILVRYPYTSEYDSEFAKSNIDLSIEQYYYEITSAASSISDFYVLDYYSAFFDKPEYFSDAHHLNAEGALVLTQMIKQDLADIKTSNKKTFLSQLNQAE